MNVSLAPRVPTSDGAASVLLPRLHLVTDTRRGRNPFPEIHAALAAGARVIQVIADVVAATSLPVIAIGGVTPEHVPELLAAGAHGVAVVSAISQAADPYAVPASFLRALQGAA